MHLIVCTQASNAKQRRKIINKEIFIYFLFIFFHRNLFIEEKKHISLYILLTNDNFIYFCEEKKKNKMIYLEWNEIQNISVHIVWTINKTLFNENQLAIKTFGRIYQRR